MSSKAVILWRSYERPERGVAAPNAWSSSKARAGTPRSLYRSLADPHRIALPVPPPARLLARSARWRSPAAPRQPFVGSAGLVFPRSRTSVGVVVMLLTPPPLAEAA